MTIQAHAKVNLVLQIRGKRADGFHNIETLMVPISLADEIGIEIEDGAGIKLTCDQPDLPLGPGNLVWKAVEAFKAQTGRQFGVRLDLKKRIPHGAGLGGGSSDAAAVLVALNAELGTGLSENTLEGIAATLGSDIPFFIRSRAAWCHGRGEILRQAPPLPETHLLLVKPPFSVSTPWAYKNWLPSESESAQKPGTQNLDGLEPGNNRETARKCTLTPSFGNFRRVELVNDLEAPVFQKHLLLRTLKAWLQQQPEVSTAMMSGSGSTIFAVLIATPQVPAPHPLLKEHRRPACDEPNAPCEMAATEPNRDDWPVLDLQARLHARFGASIWTACVQVLQP